MFRFILACACLMVVSAQQYNRDPKTAAIISEQRYQSGDGQFGAAYTQEDGTDFKEETDADGTRHGSYSYIDPSGQKRTVSYTAGKNGFQASGDHLPQAPPAPPQAAPQQQYQPQPQYQPQQQYRQSAPQSYQAPQQPQKLDYDAGNAADYDDGSYDPRYNDPSFSTGPNKQQRFAPAPVQQHYQPQPQAPIRPQQPQHQPQYQDYNPAPQHQPQYTTESSHRFQPPGKLSLNRTPDGFSYSFNKV